MQITLQNYKKLLVRIQKTITKTQENIVRNVNREKVVMSWEIGKEIETHLKENNRAGYGEKLFRELNKDTSIARTALYQMHSFYKTYPKLPSEEKSLSWSHYRNLIAVKDTATRAQLENLVIQKNLGSDKLQKEIGKTKKVKKKTAPQKEGVKLRVKRGKLFTYSKAKDGEIDLGFHTYLTSSRPSSLDARASENLRNRGKNKEILESLRDSRMTEVGGKPEFTYLAKLERVVDGDTLHVKLDLGFGVKHHEILRLAKIAADETGTKTGDNSTKELKKILQDVPFLIIRTNKTDIYGRYVADVFFDKKEKDPQKVAESGTYLNQLLLDEGLAKFWS